MKKLTLFFALLCASVTMFAEVATFNLAEFKGQGTGGSGSEVTATVDNITVSSAKAYCADNGNHMKVYAGGDLTITPQVAKITKIEVTLVSGKLGTWKVGEDALTPSGTLLTWEGEATDAVVLSNTANSQANLTKVEVTYEVTGEVKYKVTYDLNGGEGTIADTNEYAKEATVTVTSDEPTKENYIFQGWLNNKNENTYTAGQTFAISSNVTLTAQWEYNGPVVKYEKVTDAETLAAGQTLLIVNEEKEKVAGALEGAILTAIDLLDIDTENGIINITTEDAQLFTLAGEKDAWILKAGEDVISEKEAKKLQKADGTWTIEITNGDAVVKSTNPLRYNTGSPRFTTYASGQAAIQLYRLPVEIVKYKVNIADTDNGTIVADKEEYEAGEMATLTITPAKNSRMESLLLNNQAVDISAATRTIARTTGELEYGDVSVVEETYTYTYKFEITENTTAQIATIATIPTHFEDNSMEALDANMPMRFAFGEQATLYAAGDKKFKSTGNSIMLKDESYFMEDALELTIAEDKRTISFEANAGNDEDNYYEPYLDITLSSEDFIPDTYTITGDNRIVPEKDRATEGEEVKVTITPAENHLMTAIYVNGEEPENYDEMSRTITKDELGDDNIYNQQFVYVYTLRVGTEDVVLTADYEQTFGIEKTEATNCTYDFKPHRVLPGDLLYVTVTYDAAQYEAPTFQFNDDNYQVFEDEPELTENDGYRFEIPEDYGGSADINIFSLTVECEEKEIVPLSLAEFIEAKPAKEEVELKDLTVILANGKNTYVIDEEGTALVIYDNGKTFYDGTLAAGTVLTGQKATYNLYNNQDQIVPTNTAQTSEGIVPTPIKFTAQPTTADVNKYIRLENVAAAAKNNERTYYAFNGDLQLYGVTSALKPTADGNYDVEGIVVNYKGTQLELIVTHIESAGSTPSSLESVIDGQQVTKVVENGVVYIIRNGERYNMLGERVR